MTKRSLLEIQIIQLLKNKDEEGMTLLYNNYGETLYGIAFKVTKNEELAQDVLQESLVKIWKKIHTYDEDKSKLFTWLFRITRNTAIDKIRSTSLKTDQEIQIDSSNVYNVGIDTVKPEFLDVKDHLDTLEEKYKIVLEALFFQGMTQQEASEELDIPLGTIKSRLKIGLRELRKIYGPTLAVLLYVMMQ